MKQPSKINQLTTGVEQVPNKKTPAQRDREQKTYQNQLRIVMKNCNEIARMCSSAERVPREFLEITGMNEEIIASLVDKTTECHTKFRAIIYTLREEQERERRLKKL